MSCYSSSTLCVYYLCFQCSYLVSLNHPSKEPRQPFFLFLTSTYPSYSSIFLSVDGCYGGDGREILQHLPIRSNRYPYIHHHQNHRYVTLFEQIYFMTCQSNLSLSFGALNFHICHYLSYNFSRLYGANFSQKYFTLLLN